MLNRYTLALALATLFALACPIGCGSEMTPPKPDCATDADCGPDQHCAVSKTSGSAVCVDIPNPCPAGQTAECTGDAGIILCIDLQTNADHCGACGVVCPLNVQGAQGTCVGGECREAPCSPRTCKSSSPPYCGMLDDDCGGVVDCGGCPVGQTCGLGAKNYCAHDGCTPFDAPCSDVNECCKGSYCNDQGTCECTLCP